MESNQINEISSSASDVYGVHISAEQIIRELEDNNEMTVDALLDRGAEIFNTHMMVESAEDASAMVECLKLFITADKILDEQKAEQQTGMPALQPEHCNNATEEDTALLKPQILMFIALCNLKMDNKILSYCAARQGLAEIDRIMADEPADLSAEMLGQDTLNSIVAALKEEGFSEDEYAHSFEDVDVKMIETRHFEEVTGISLSALHEEVTPTDRNFLYSIIKRLDAFRSRLMNDAIILGNTEAMHTLMSLYDVANVVFYVWEGCKYGHLSDFWKEDVATETYKLFQKDLFGKISEQYRRCKANQFPLKSIDEDGSLERDFLKLLEFMQGN